jgi:hypothetical protein
MNKLFKRCRKIEDSKQNDHNHDGIGSCLFRTDLKSVHDEKEAIEVTTSKYISTSELPGFQ